MPWQMSWKFRKKLNTPGLEILDTKADDTCHNDRCLISGASPKPANDFWKVGSRNVVEDDH